MNNDNYLQYIRVLYDRISNNSKRTGFNIWVLLIGIIYLIWNTIPLFNSLKNDSNSFKISLTYYSHIHIFILYFFFISTTYKKLSTPLDYRILNYRKITEFKEIINILIRCFLLLIPPVYATHLVLQSTITLSTFHIYQLGVNKWFLVIMVVVILFRIFFSPIYQKFKGYPYPPFFIPAKLPELFKLPFLAIITYLLLLLIIMELPIGNMYLLINNYLLTENIKLTEAITFAFNISLVSFAIVILLDIYRSQENLRNLERLERDIIIHKIDESEIKMRLQEEYLGHEIGEWLTNELKEVKSKAELVIEFIKKRKYFYTEEYKNSIIKEIEESIVELKDKSQEIIKEKTEEIIKNNFEKYITEADKAFDNYRNKYNGLFRFLDSSLLSFQDWDPYLKGILSNTLKDLYNVMSDVSTQMNNSKEKLELKKKNLLEREE